MIDHRYFADLWLSEDLPDFVIAALAAVGEIAESAILDQGHDCETASLIWHALLAQRGVATTVVRGTFRAGRVRVPHVWLQFGGLIIDPTGSQFVALESVEPDESRYQVPRDRSRSRR